MAENDNYDRKELIKMVSGIFDNEMSEEELNKRAELWYLADHATDADTLAILSKCPYVEVREGVAASANTPISLLIALSRDEDFQVRETVILNRNTPQSVVDALENDENAFVREAVARRRKQK